MEMFIWLSALSIMMFECENLTLKATMWQIRTISEHFFLNKDLFIFAAILDSWT